jgi:Skp family chaperone for outer membrane proteins
MWIMRFKPGVTIGVVALSGALLVVVWTQGWAQAPGAGISYAVVDVERILDDCQMGVDVRRLLEERTETLQQSLETRRQAIHSKQADYTALHPDSAEARKLLEDLDRAQIQLDTLQKIQQGELLRERKLWAAEGYRQAMAAIEHVAAGRDLDMVLFHDRYDAKNPPDKIIERMAVRRVLYAKKHLDLTDEVIKLVNQEYAQRGGAASIKIGL